MEHPSRADKHPLLEDGDASNASLHHSAVPIDYETPSEAAPPPLATPLFPPPAGPVPASEAPSNGLFEGLTTNTDPAPQPSYPAYPLNNPPNDAPPGKLLFGGDAGSMGAGAGPGASSAGLFSGLNTQDPAAAPPPPAAFYPGSIAPPPYGTPNPLPALPPVPGSTGQEHAARPLLQPPPSYASMMPPGYGPMSDAPVHMGYPVSGGGIGMAPPTIPTNTMGAVFSIPELPEAALYWQSQQNFMMSWSITSVTNIVLNILFMALLPVWGIMGGIMGCIASGLYVCKCGGEVITGALKTMRVLAYVGAGFNVFQGFIYFLLICTEAKALEAGGVLFLLMLIMWHGFCAHSCIDGGRKAMTALRMSGLLAIPDRYIYGINVTL